VHSADYLITHTNTCTHTHTHIYIYIYILFKKSKIYLKTFKKLLHVSITRSSSGSIYCELLHYVKFGAVAACHVFLCVSRTVFIMSLVMVVRRVLCSVRLTLRNIRRTTITRHILNTVRLTHKNQTCCHSTTVNITK